MQPHLMLNQNDANVVELPDLLIRRQSKLWNQKQADAPCPADALGVRASTKCTIFSA